MELALVKNVPFFSHTFKGLLYLICCNSNCNPSEILSQPEFGIRLLA